MSNGPFFSVVIPVFNRCDTITKCIDSVLKQEFKDFEIVVVDDGSSDGTANIVRSIPDARIRLVEQKNGGASKARNTGIQNSIGKYIAFLDSDDVFLSNHLQQSFDALSDDGKTCTYAPIIVDRGDDVQLIKPGRSIRENEHISDYLMTDRGFVPTISLVVPNSLANKVLYDESLSKGDDYDFAIRLVANGAVLKMLPMPAAIWDDRWNPNRLSNRKNTEERIEWLNRIRNIVTDKAYYAELGWPVAKYIAEDGNKFLALKYYFKALFKGCFKVKMAIVIFLQIILSKSAYRKMSDLLAKFGVQP